MLYTYFYAPSQYNIGRWNVFDRMLGKTKIAEAHITMK
jgi:hypothetical protein